MKGTCRLTLQDGVFVKSHLIPQVYTRPSIAGAHLVQGGGAEWPIKRWSSWYDPRLVIQSGEDILSRYDNVAHRELSRLKLLWSSWGPMLSLSTSDQHLVGDDSPYGIRKIEKYDSNCLRLFFLSLLWRAASTKLREFEEIALETAQLEKLREHVLIGNPGSSGYYGVNLIQLSTRSTVQNLAPIRGIKRIPTMVGKTPDFKNPSRSIDIFRFYLDGLIAHIHCQPEEDTSNLLLIGGSDH